MDFKAFDRSKLDDYSRQAKMLYSNTPEAQGLVKRIQEFIIENLYICSNKILRGIGKMYSGGGSLLLYDSDRLSSFLRFHEIILDILNVVQ